MNKIINILLLGMVGVLGGIFIISVWLIGIIFLLANEIILSRKFRTKLHKLNEIIVSEFKEILNVFHGLNKVN